MLCDSATLEIWSKKVQLCHIRNLELKGATSIVPDLACGPLGHMLKSGTMEVVKVATS